MSSTAQQAPVLQLSLQAVAEPQQPERASGPPISRGGRVSSPCKQHLPALPLSPFCLQCLLPWVVH